MQAILSEISRSFPASLKENLWIVPQIKPRQLPSLSSSIHYIHPIILVRIVQNTDNVGKLTT
jgi:hypothetical protein